MSSTNSIDYRHEYIKQKKIYLKLIGGIKKQKFPEFKKAKTFEDIQKLYFDFLNGKINKVPTYFGKLEKDTIEQLKDIIEINKLGLLTIDSQNCLKDGIYKQRAYIVGLIKKDVAKSLVDQLNQNDSIVSLCQNIWKGQSKLLYNVRFVDYPVTCNIDDQKDCPTRDPFLPNSESLEIILDEMDPSLTNEDKDEIMNEVCYFTAVDTVWEREDFLAQAIIKCLQQSSLKN